MFDPKIKIGDVLSEEEVASVFGCQTQLGIRLNKKNHAIVIVSTTYKDDYSDYWDGDTLFYVGTNASADEHGQTLSGHGNNNGALKAVWTADDKPTLFLFEKYTKNSCTYKGIVTLCKEPYKEPKSTDSDYSIWRFPLKLAEVDFSVLTSDYQELEQAETQKEFQALKEAVISAGRSRVIGREHISRPVTTKTFDRNPVFSSYTKKRARGVCDLCNRAAPFYDKHGNPYLESHHVIWLSRGGDDFPTNMVALCPNCHSQIHVLDAEADRQKLFDKLADYSSRGE